MKFDNPRIVQAKIDAPEHTIFFDVENPLAETLFGQLTSSLDSRAIDNVSKHFKTFKSNLRNTVRLILVFPIPVVRFLSNRRKYRLL